MPQQNDTERALMALLQQERARNGSTQVAQPALPELDLTMFLSPTAQREMAAMQGIPDIATPLITETIQANRQELSIRPAVVAEEIDLMSSNWDITEQDLEPAPRYSSESVEPDLANLFMDRALRETGLSPVEQRRAERLGAVDDFSFSTTDFEVDMPRTYEAPAQRSSGGVVVAQRGPTGFTQVSRPEAVERYAARQPAAPVAPAQPAAPAAPVLSRYERLLRPSVID